MTITAAVVQGILLTFALMVTLAGTLTAIAPPRGSWFDPGCRP